jgi:hypothetical protein
LGARRGGPYSELQRRRRSHDRRKPSSIPDCNQPAAFRLRVLSAAGFLDAATGRKATVGRAAQTDQIARIQVRYGAGVFSLALALRLGFPAQQNAGSVARHSGLAMKIFWAWQSDLRGKTGRHFIKGALEEAIDRINESREIEEPDENLQNGMQLDHDRKGLPGSPDLANEILMKIDASTVFVCDVTPVGIGGERKNDEGAASQKPLMNPNVAIELGYALKSLSTHNILMLMNSHYGSRADLPFDLGHKGGPIFYDLPRDADKHTIEVQRKQLVGTLVEALRLFVPKPAVEIFQEAKAKIGKGIYFSEGEILGTDKNNPPNKTEYTMPFRDVVWLRVIPRKPLRIPLSVEELREVAPGGSFGYGSGFGRVRENNYDVAFFYHMDGTSTIDSISQFMRNGEIWGVNSELLRYGNEAERKYVHTLPIEDQCLRTLRWYIEIIRKVGKVELPIQVEAGIEGIKGRVIAHQGFFINNAHVIYEDSVVHRGILTTFNPKDQADLLMEFFRKLNNNTGVPRRSGLYGRS